MLSFVSCRPVGHHSGRTRFFPRPSAVAPKLVAKVDPFLARKIRCPSGAGDRQLQRYVNLRLSLVERKRARSHAPSVAGHSPAFKVDPFLVRKILWPRDAVYIGASILCQAWLRKNRPSAHRKIGHSKPTILFSRASSP